MSTMREASAAARAAVTTRQTGSVICADLMSLNAPMNDEQHMQRAKLIYNFLLTQKRLQLLRDRAECLGGDLARFRERREQIARRA